VLTLQLLVDLYHAQDLREEEGVSRRLTWQEFARVAVGERGQFRVWGFRYKNGWLSWDSPVTTRHRRNELTPDERARRENAGVDFFRRQGQLVAAGLLEWVPTLFESDNDEAESLHPYGLGGSDSLEDRLGRAAHAAAEALLTPGQRIWANDEGLSLVPVPQHIAKVQMIGIARLRYRPRTSKTAAWWADLQRKGEQVQQRYLSIAGGEEALRAAAI
jgi:hypothetical protein